VESGKTAGTDILDSAKLHPGYAGWGLKTPGYPIGLFHCQEGNNHAEIATKTRTIETIFSVLLAEMTAILSCVATMTSKSRSVNIVLSPKPSSGGKAEIDGSISCIHVYLLLGIAMKTRNPYANRRCEKILSITFIGTPIM
jgi:hypothetical protein